MANKVTIDVEARFVDNLTDGAKDAAQSFDEIEKAAKEAEKEIDDVGKKKVKPKVDVDTSNAKKKIDAIDKKVDKFGRTKAEAKMSVLDKATQVINKVTSKVKSFGSKTYSALLKVRDSNALNTLSKMSSGLRNLTSKTWTTAVKLKDYATAPLRGLKNMLFSIQSLVMAITAGLAAKQFVINPINLADQYSSAQIGFSTLLGESRGQQMMNDLDEFAKATPFKSSQVIGQTQRMLAMGWDAEKIIEDMGTIGDAAAATGKGEQGLQQIVTALAQIKTKGRLSTEELNQLAEAGVSAKRYIAEGLGYGSGDAGIAKMTKDLEKGAISSDKALQALLSGMKEYKGMMDKTANETVEGLWSQIEDTFEINIFRRWGQGLQDGAKGAFGTVVELLDKADGALTEFGDTIYEVGKSISNWVADKFENAVKRITEITDSYEFRNASLGEKISMLWNGVIVDPLKEWWENGGQQKTAETAGKVGSWMGEMLTKGLLALFGATDILDEGVGSNAGSSVAGSFLQGFLDNFDGSAITNAIVDAIGNVWGALPWWAKILIGGYGVGKAAGGIASFAGGVANFAGGVKNVVGGFNIASSAFPILTSSGSGILGAVGKAGVALGASTTGGALLAGTAGIGGGIAAGAATIKGGVDLYNAYKANKAGDEIETQANLASGGTALGGVAAGAAIGAILGPLGALVGAGIGGIAGWLAGDAWADSIRAAKYDSEEMKEAIKDSEMSAEELAEVFAKAKWENARKHFGDIKLSLTEIERLADQIVWGDDMGTFEKFTASTQAAEASLQSLKTASEQTDRWMWKAALGVKFNEDEIESIKQSVDDYINSAKSFVENKHYEFTAAVSLLVDVESDGGKSVIESGDAFYGKIQEQLNGLGSELSKTVEIALEDGVITLDEQKEITNLQKQIAEITTKIANAEQKAELDLIKVKFGKGNLDYESFENFMAQMQTTIDERMTANDDAFIASVSSLNLQLADGAISQEEYDKQLQTIIDGYTGTVESLQAEVKNVELEIIGEAYAQELGNDAAADLEKALQYAIDEGIDPIEISSEKLAELLNVESLPEETASNIKDMLSGVLNQMELLEVDGNLMLKIGEVQTDGNVEEKVKNAVPDAVDDTVTVNITGQKIIETMDQVLPEDFKIPETIDENVIVKLNAAKTVQDQVDVLASEFGIKEEEAETILWKLTGEKSVLNRISISADDFGIPDSVSKTVTVKVNATYAPGHNPYTSGNSSFTGGVSNYGKGSGYRGGIFGGDSAMDAFARGGRTDDGIVGGSTRLIRVNEESPEMIIPLSSQRRERALKLWNKTGEILGVPGFYRGGRSDGDQDEGIRFRSYGGGESNSSREVHVDIGGVKLEINVSGTDRESIVEAIKAQAGELADYLVGILADALEEQFENTPVRGGAA